MKMKKVKKSPFERKQKGIVAIPWVISAFWLFSTTGCSELENSDEDGLFLYAKVENASEFSNVVTVILKTGEIELARGKWKDDGFTIFLPKTVDSNYLRTISMFLPTAIIDPPSTLTISGNKNLNFLSAYFWGYDKDGNYIARFSPYDREYPHWDGIPYFTYIDSDLTISGYIEEDVLAPIWNVIDSHILYNWKKTTTYSIEWNKGWNFWRFSGTQSLLELGIMTEEWSTTPKDRVKWMGVAKY